MRDSEFLRQVKRRLKTRDLELTTGICCVIRQTYADLYLEGGSQTKEQTQSLLDWVSTSIGSNLWLYNWIKGEIGFERFNAEYTPEKLRETRLAWLDWMIKECEKNENNT